MQGDLQGKYARCLCRISQTDDKFSPLCAANSKMEPGKSETEKKYMMPLLFLSLDTDPKLADLLRLKLLVTFLI